MTDEELERRRAQWAEDKLRWEFVLATYWQLSYERLVEVLSRCKTLDEAVVMAEHERDGMVAT
jgi:hypothetical protein